MQPDRRAHRFGDRLAIGAGDHESELVHGFSDGDPLDIGPGVAAEQPGPLTRCDVGLVEGLEPDVFCVRIGFGDRHQILQWETGPRNDHRPRLDAAMPHDALFKRDLLQQIVDADRERFFDFAVESDLPWPYRQFGRLRGDPLGRAELIEIVEGDVVFLSGNRSTGILELGIGGRRIERR